MRQLTNNREITSAFTNIEHTQKKIILKQNIVVIKKISAIDTFNSHILQQLLKPKFSFNGKQCPIIFN